MSHSDLTETLKDSAAAFVRMKSATDAAAEAWRAFAREVVKAQPLPADWQPTHTITQWACHTMISQLPKGY